MQPRDALMAMDGYADVIDYGTPDFKDRKSAASRIADIVDINMDSQNRRLFDSMLNAAQAAFSVLEQNNNRAKKMASAVFAMASELDRDKAVNVLRDFRETIGIKRGLVWVMAGQEIYAHAERPASTFALVQKVY